MTYIHVKEKQLGTCCRCKTTKSSAFINRYKTRTQSRFASVFDDKTYCKDCYIKYFLSRGKE